MSDDFLYLLEVAVGVIAVALLVGCVIVGRSLRRSK